MQGYMEWIVIGRRNEDNSRFMFKVFASDWRTAKDLADNAFTSGWAHIQDVNLSTYDYGTGEPNLRPKRWELNERSAP